MPLESAVLSKITMVSPKQLAFSSSGGDSDDTLSRRKSPRDPSSKRAAASDPTEADEEIEKMKKKKMKKKKKKKKKNKEKLASPLFSRIWNEEDELVVLKGLVDYRAKTGFETKIDWDAFYRFLGGSMVGKFSKEQVLSKIRKLKARFLVHLEKINEGSDPKFTRSSDSEAFGFSMMIWGQNEVEFGSDDGGMDKEMLKEQEEPVNGNGAANGTARLEQQRENGEEMLKEQEEPVNGNGVANGTARLEQQRENGEEMLKEREEPANDNGVANGNARLGQQSENGEEMLKEQEEPVNDNGVANGTARLGQQRENVEGMLKEHEEVANTERLYENGTAKTRENGTTVGKESHDDDDDELCAVRDAFETVMSQGLSDYQKKLQLEKLMNIGTGKRRELSNEWKALCVEESRLNIKKLRFSAKLAEAANDS